MILVWDNVKSFKRHLEEMRLFRHSHDSPVPAEFKTLKDMPIPIDDRPADEVCTNKSIYDSRGKLIIVPIWGIIPPRGWQN